MAIWFFSCGLIHSFVEGYFVTFHSTISFLDSPLANLWKEYAKSDSRYMISDPTVLIIEGITAYLWGPLSFYTAYLCFTNNPVRHIFQILISLGQLYGDVLYYSTTLLEGSPHCDPRPFYFWFYFVFMNSLWILFPILIIGSSGRVIWKALVGHGNPKPFKKLSTSPRRSPRIKRE